jgi:putative transposase
MFWQTGGGFDRNITEPQTLESMIDYIHQNPVRRGLVERPSDWVWSSAGWYEGKETTGLVPDRIPPE